MSADRIDLCSRQASRSLRSNNPVSDALALPLGPYDGHFVPRYNLHLAIKRHFLTIESNYSTIILSLPSPFPGEFLVSDLPSYLAVLVINRVSISKINFFPYKSAPKLLFIFDSPLEWGSDCTLLGLGELPAGDQHDECQTDSKRSEMLCTHCEFPPLVGIPNPLTAQLATFGSSSKESARIAASRIVYRLGSLDMPDNCINQLRMSRGLRSRHTPTPRAGRAAGTPGRPREYPEATTDE